MTIQEAKQLKVGDRVTYAVGNVSRVLTVEEHKEKWQAFRGGEVPGEFGYLALVGDRENQSYFVWLDAGYEHASSA